MDKKTRKKNSNFSGNGDTWKTFLEQLDDASINIVVSHGDFIKHHVLENENKNVKVRNAEVYFSQKLKGVKFGPFKPLDDMFSAVARQYGRNEEAYCGNNPTMKAFDDSAGQGVKNGAKLTTVFIVRHGQSCSNVANPLLRPVQRGLREPFLTLTGCEQSLTAGCRINAELKKMKAVVMDNKTRVKMWCSYFKRAMQTASLISTQIDTAFRPEIIQRSRLIGEEQKIYDKFVGTLSRNFSFPFGGLRSQTFTDDVQSERAMEKINKANKNRAVRIRFKEQKYMLKM